MRSETRKGKQGKSISWRDTVRGFVLLKGLAVFICIIACSRGLIAAEALDLRVSTDRSIDPSSFETICKSVCEPGMTEEERALALWNMFNTKMYHWDRISKGHWDIICTYGYSLCGTMWRTFSMLYLYEFGDGTIRGGGYSGWAPDSEWGRLMKGGWLVDSYLMNRKIERHDLYGPYNPAKARKKPVAGGHTMGEVKFNGAFHLLDPHAGFYVYTADGKEIATGLELASDPSLVSDPVKIPSRFMPCDEKLPLFYYRVKGGSSGGGSGKKPDNRVFPTNLRAGLRYVRYYGKTFPHAYVYSKGWERMPDWYRTGGPRHLCNKEEPWRHYGNGEVVFEPEAIPLWREAVVNSENLAADVDGGLRGKDPSKIFSFSVEFQTPYIFVTETVTGEVKGKITISNKKRTVWKSGGGAPTLDVKPHQKNTSLGRKIVYRVQGEAGATIKNLRLAPVFQYNYFMSPRPKPGKNKVKVAWSNQSKMAGRAVKVTWTWKEKAGDKRDERIIAESGTEYGLNVGKVGVKPNAEMNPTYIDALVVEVVKK